MNNSSPEKEGVVSTNGSYGGGGGPTPSRQEEDQKQNKKAVVVVRYKECLRNYAATIGGSATDGCGEFMPSGEEGTIEALICSACNCHRNFHRKEFECDSPFECNQHSDPLLLNINNVGIDRTLILSHASYNHNHHHHHLVRSSQGYLVTEPPHDDHQVLLSNKSGSFRSESGDKEDGSGGVVERPVGKLTRKRFRTKFTQEQKEKMFNFAEKAGWRMQKLEESVVQQFCQEIGIKRRVLKVWMHNNKHSLAKKQSSHT